jgi:phosphopantothenoylcysteine decarboxylase/phosphopantothenate--cysteine ligase
MKQRILTALQAALFPRRDWSGRRVLISAGPTQEAIDPVRFISNRSSGKMGYALAEAAQARGVRRWCWCQAPRPFPRRPAWSCVP